jgi:hypothetical protein
VGGWLREDLASPRARMAYTLDTRRRRLVIFGGRFRAGTTGDYTNYNDLWSFDLATQQWEALTSESTAPTARSNASLVYDTVTDTYVLFGGNTSANGLTFVPRNDVWTFAPEARTWTRVTTTGTAPSTRLFHAAAVSGRTMFIYGGGGANAFMGPFYSDLWKLDLDTNAWSRPTLSGTTTALGGRISSALFAASDGTTTVLAGHDDGALGNRNDVVSVSPSGSIRSLREGDEINTPGAGFCDFPADFTTTDMDAPERRSAFVAAWDAPRNRAIVYGGKTDCGLAGDVWSVDLTTATWRSLRGSTDGLSCQRSGRSNCRSLCN